MENFNAKSEFYCKLEKYYLDKPGKKPLRLKRLSQSL